MREIKDIKKALQPMEIQVPGSKSYTCRALLLGALAEGESLLTGALESTDTIAMVKALHSLGIRILKTREGLLIQGCNGKFSRPTSPLNVENSGIAARTLMAALALQSFESVLTGKKQLRERPMEDLIEALKQLGAQVKSNDGYLPVTVHGPLKGGTTLIKGTTSSQFISALLMASPLTEKTVTIHVKGELTSLPYVDMTLETMEKFGVSVKNDNFKTFTIQPQKYIATHYSIEGDASSATYPLALAALHGSKMTITNVPGNSRQADTLFLDILQKMGCKTVRKPGSISVHGPKQLKPLGNIDLNKLPDSAITIAMICVFTEGTSKLMGIGNLRYKETDRIHALKTELTKIGASVEEGQDYLVINGNPSKLHGEVIETYDDHRLAMCFAIAGSKIPGIKIKNPDCVQKTYPTFWKDLKKWGIHMR